MKVKKYMNQFGGKVTAPHVDRYQSSAQWKGKQFENLVTTTMDVNLFNLPGLLKQQFSNRTERAPLENIPILPFQEDVYAQDISKPKFVWYGHSVLLLQLDGKNLLIDPMLGDNASPIAPFATKRFSEGALDVIDNLPKIDAVLITHDHYDHLDLDSILRLKDTVSTYIVALGVSRHLEKWGIPRNQIQEMDWWQSINFRGIEVTFTPSRHFSGRGMRDRAKCLWGGWVFESNQHKIYWSGDGGYGDHFKEVGERFGSFDWAFMECGQYHNLWHQIHMYPEESVQAALDVKAKVAIPVHWGAFVLALHTWTDPIDRFTLAADRQQLKVSTPRIGEVVVLNDEQHNHWWKEVE